MASDYIAQAASEFQRLMNQPCSLVSLLRTESLRFLRG